MDKHYLDYNATMPMTQATIDTVVKWINQGNPSADYAVAPKKLMKQFVALINDTLGLGDQYCVLFTSGASESNSTFLRMVADYYMAKFKVIPHFLASETEHKSIIDTLDNMQQLNIAEYTLAPVDTSGACIVEMIPKFLRPNTACISVMHANNETGCINNVAAIGQIAAANNIIFHSDLAQTFLKYPAPLRNWNIDAASVSFHKCHGPAGAGLLIVRRGIAKLLKPIIAGTQNYGLRGGTENIPAIAGAKYALEALWPGRTERNQRLVSLKQYLLQSLAKIFPTRSYAAYLSQEAKTPELIIISTSAPGRQQQFLPNTVLLSVVRKTPPQVCNTDMKKEMAKMGVIVSVGSACNTASTKASHVLYAIQGDEYIRRGTIRISFGDFTTKKDIDAFVVSFQKVSGRYFR